MLVRVRAALVERRGQGGYQPAGGEMSVLRSRLRVGGRPAADRTDVQGIEKIYDARMDDPRGQLVLAWRRDDRRELVADYARACQEVVAANR